MQNRDVKDILFRYRSNSCTEEERALVENWIMFGKFQDLDLTDAELEEDISEIGRKLPVVIRKKARLWPHIAAAAIVLIAVATGLYFNFPPSENSSQEQVKANAGSNILPGGNKAILTLSDGRKIALDDANNGQLAEQSGIKITKTEDGQLTYTVSNRSIRGRNAEYNTIETPRGGQYRIILPDGSRVWLNSTSSLRFPAIFAVSNRTVELKGEAYFEVKHEKSPFRVKTISQEVEVLGTHFNINSYSDEAATKTTLLEGSVKVTAAASSVSKILTPGQQAVQQSNFIKVNEVDTESAVAWKNGLFVFDDETLETIMRSVARWYEVDVVYQKDVNKGLLFGGSVSRYDNVSKVIEKLELTGGVHFKVEGRRITVMK